MPSSREYLHAKEEIHPALPKLIIRPWEELVNNKHRIGLGYDKEASFHILDYSKPIQFQSVGFLHDNSPVVVSNSSPLPQQQHNVKC